VAIDANAHFSELPFSSSNVSFENNVLDPLGIQSACDHPAGNVGDEQVCSLMYQVAGRIGGYGLAAHPELFRNRFGGELVDD
jgi:hypothetical protein